MRKYALLVSYLGTSYCGWQRQKGSAASGAPSIQATMEEALFKMTGERRPVVGSGRTDAGVHAVGQVAHIALEKKEWEEGVLQKGLNAILPLDIRVREVCPVDIAFHAQRSAIDKQYAYYIYEGVTPPPHLLPLMLHTRHALDREAIRRAIRFLVGEHDFKPFRASGAAPGSTVRKIFEAELTELPVPFPPGGWSEGSVLRVRILGSGFLKQMVRGIVGTLVQIGQGKYPPEKIREILESGDRARVGPTALAQGLWLEFVTYSPEFSLSWSLDRRTEAIDTGRHVV